MILGIILQLTAILLGMSAVFYWFSPVTVGMFAIMLYMIGYNQEHDARQRKERRAQL